ncbi:MAG: 16S rRNA (guanine(966)-N(2))-methyltransferase RsmD [Aureibaculum sp.]|nr:16S rRNA (guanine(966)-N(2))-methyltransferase RsmD [Aureibaculum sp.]
MRIISGKYKGRRITAPKNLPARPTTDISKEALFNILNNKFYFNSLSVLDLFAGIGSISFEFASRGADDIICVDQHYNSLKFIQKTAQELNFDIKTIKSDVFKYLEKTTLKHDVIFADPPYNFEKDQFANIITLVFDNDLVTEDGILIIEHSKHTDLSDIKHFDYSKKYGGSMFSFFENKHS